MESKSSPPPVPVLDVIGAKVEAELTRLLYRSAGFSVFSNAVLALVMVAGLRDFDRGLEQAAEGLGASRWRTLWRITAPLSAIEVKTRVSPVTRIAS